MQKCLINLTNSLNTKPLVKQSVSLYLASEDWSRVNDFACCHESWGNSISLYVSVSLYSRGAYLRFRYVKISQLWHISYVPNQLLKSFNFQSLILISNFETLSQNFYLGKKNVPVLICHPVSSIANWWELFSHNWIIKCWKSTFFVMTLL